LQPRAAQELIQGIAPSAKVGRSFLLSRGDLERFLDRIAEGAEPASILAPKAPAPRRSLRELIQTDSIPATLETAPQNLTFNNGRLSIEFASMADLAGSLVALTEILSDPDQFAEFERRYIPARLRLADPDEGRAEMERLFTELSDLELTYAEKSVLDG
jgi:hypothetical protein